MKTTFASECLVHHLPETSTSPVGPVCRCCKQALYVETTGQRRRSYWESQPLAYTMDGEPLFVYVRQIDHVELRSLREDLG